MSRSRSRADQIRKSSLAQARPRLLNLEALDRRELCAADLAVVAGQFNDGLAQLKSLTPALVDNAFSHDLADIPLVEERRLADQLGLAGKLASLFAGHLDNTASVDAAIVELTAEGLQVEYLGLEADGRGDFLRVRSRLDQPIRDVRIGVGGEEVFGYLAAARGALSGQLTGRVDRLVGNFVIGVDSFGLYVDQGSTLRLQKLRLQGDVAGSYAIGALSGVAVSGRAAINGTLAVTLDDPDDDHRLRTADFSRDDAVRGKLQGHAELSGDFRGQIPLVTDVRWTGKLQADIDGRRITQQQQLIAPDYQQLIDKIGPSFLTQLRQIDFVDQVSAWLQKDLPLVNKSLAELLDIENRISQGISVLGLQWLSRADGQRAMQDLVQGKVVDLLRFDHDGSIGLWDGDLIEPIRLGQTSLIPGLLAGRLDAELRASLEFIYDVSLGINTKGMWIGESSRVGVRGTIEGGLSGSISVFGFDALKATGSLGIPVTLSVQVTDPTPGDKRIYLPEIATRPADVPAAVARLLSTDFVASLQASVKGKIRIPLPFGLSKSITVFKAKVDLGTVLEIHLGPRSGGPAVRPRLLAATREQDLTWEAEELPVVAKSPGSNLALQDMEPVAPGVFSHGSQLLVTGQAAGDWADFEVAMSQPGQHRLRLHLAEGRDFGSVRIWLNGQLLAGPVATSAETAPSRAEPLDLGLVSLRQGSNILRVELVGPAAAGQFAVGIDGLELEDVSAEAGLPAPITGLQVANRWQTAADIRWTPAVGASWYRVELATPAGWSEIGRTAGNDVAFRVNGLTPAGNYRLRVTGVNARGDGPAAEIPWTTRDTLPREPGQLRAVNVYARAVDLQWIDQSQNDQNETEFRIAISRDGGATWDNAGTTAANNTSFRVTGLTPNTRYLFKARSANGEGYSEYTSVVEVVTRDEPPAAPSQLGVANLWATQLDLAWRDNSANETQFVVEMSTDGIQWRRVQTAAGNRTGVRISGLAANTPYYFRVLAENPSGLSAPSNVVSIRTKR